MLVNRGLQLIIKDGFLDGSVNYSQTCNNAKGAEERNEEKANLINRKGSFDAVSFTTRSVNEGVVTLCTYSGQIVGDARRSIAGDVTCDLRDGSSGQTLAFNGTWRAIRKSVP